MCYLELIFFFSFYILTGDEVVTVKTPAFAESVTEGDVRWEKGKSFSLKAHFFKGILEFCNKLHNILKVEFEEERSLKVRH